MRRYEQAIALSDRCGSLWLDCARGSGFGTEILAKAADFVVGIDIDPTAISYVRRYHGRQSKIHYRVGDLSSLGLGWEEFLDVVVSIETIEHVRDCEPFLCQVYRLLRPGGVLVVTTPRSMIGGGPNPLNPHHLNELTKEQFERLTSSVFDAVQYYSEWVVMTTGVFTEQMYEICTRRR